ncbi:MAG: hypothetical protein HYZ81_02890 [Nitrospinae bacterium]|nr:hypothetical protein [Nitrospinota bacterium]
MSDPQDKSDPPDRTTPIRGTFAGRCTFAMVDPQQVHRLKGRPKRDVHDCQWLQRLHTFGLLAGAFRPAEHVCVLRRYLRQRARLLTYAGQPIQPMQKALPQMTLTLQHVVSEITGVRGWP